MQYTNINKENVCKIFLDFKNTLVKGVIIIPTFNYQFTNIKNLMLNHHQGWFSNYLLKKLKKRT